MYLLKQIKQGNSFFFLLLLVGLGAVVSLVTLALTGNSPQHYPDIIMEWTSSVAANKSAEIWLSYGLILAGIVLYAAYYALVKYTQPAITALGTREDSAKTALWATGLMMCCQLVLFADANPFLFTILGVSLFFYFQDKKQFFSGLTFFFLNLYTLYACYRWYVWAGGTHTLPVWWALLAATGVSIGVFIYTRFRSRWFTRFVLIEQLLLPGLLLIYVADIYQFDGEFLRVPYEPQIYILIFGFILLLFLTSLRNLRTYWQKPAPLYSLLTIGSCIAVVGFNLFNYTGAVVLSDLHHPFENIIGFQQIFQLGQIPYEQYIPISGLYSVLHGAVFQFLGNGYTSHYAITESIFYLLMMVGTLYLLKQFLNNVQLFLFSVFFAVVYYNRVMWVLPLMLLLSSPWLIRRPNTWLQVWFVTSLLHGLYYPVFGAAVCLAYMPLGVYQLIRLWKSADRKKLVKTSHFWLGWIGCFVLTAAFFPFLKGTYTHIRAMAIQTVLADGFARFGQNFGDALFPYTQMAGYKLIAVYLGTFLFPALVLWVAFALSLHVCNLHAHTKLKPDALVKGCVVLALVIMPLVAFSYTVVRLDVNTLYARSTGVLLAEAVLLIVYSLNYVKNSQIKQRIICFAFLIPLLVNTWGFSNQTEKLKRAYPIPPGFWIVKDIPHKIGTGFIHPFVYNYMRQPILTTTHPYFGLGLFADYYVHDVPGLSVLESLSLRSLPAAQETISLLSAYPTAVGTGFTSSAHYYLYNWLLTSGKYRWHSDKKMFLPKEPSMSLQEALAYNRTASFIDSFLNLGMTPSSWGLSMDTLYPRFSKLSNSFNIHAYPQDWIVVFDTPLLGNDADFLYLEFPNQDQVYEYTLFDMKGWKQVRDPLLPFLFKKHYNPGVTVRIQWLDNEGNPYMIEQDMGQGKLLIPLGAGARWLLDTHTELIIGVYKNGEPIAFPPLQKMLFLKLQEPSYER